MQGLCAASMRLRIPSLSCLFAQQRGQQGGLIMLHNRMPELLFEVLALDASIETILFLVLDVLTHYQNLLGLLQPRCMMSFLAENFSCAG